MAKTSKAAKRIECLKQWMIQQKLPKIKLSTSLTTNYARK